MSCELCRAKCLHVCMLIITRGTDRENWDSKDWHVDRDCSEQQTARPIVLHLSFCLPVLDQSGMGVTRGMLLALTCCRLRRRVRGQGFLPSSTMFKPVSPHNSEGRGRENTWKKEKSSKLFGKDIKNTLRCQFQFPCTVQDIVRDREPGRGPCGGTVK